MSAFGDRERELLLRFVDGQCSSEEQTVAHDLLKHDAEARGFLRSVSEQAILIADIERMTSPKHKSIATDTRLDQSSLPRHLSIVAIAASLLVAGMLGWFLQSLGSRTSPVARVTAINGSVMWTGDSGQIMTDLHEGRELTGGTLECLTPDAWVEIAFKDDSRISVFGISRLTFSEFHQKELHVHAGAVSANVRKQPAGRPMLVHTSSATFEVLGTQLIVESEQASSTLRVIDGSVKATRLSDNQSTEVSSQHRLSVAYDKSFVPARLPPAVHHWTSHLENGNMGNFGRWNSRTIERPASLKSIPFRYKEPEGNILNLFMAAFGTAYGLEAPVKVLDTSALKLHAQMTSPHYLIIGVTMRQGDGQFGGDFYLVYPADEMVANQPFELNVSLSDFQLERSGLRISSELTPDPSNLFLESVWFHTMEHNAGLEIYEVSVMNNEAE